jgi:hypothetical protein
MRDFGRPSHRGIVHYPGWDYFCGQEKSVVIVRQKQKRAVACIIAEDF